MYLVLVRHGESTYNKEKRFCGWTDVPLTEKGEEEAKRAGKLLAKTGIDFGIAYTSVLKRAKDTLSIIIDEMKIDLKVRESYKLNERHYGDLEGLSSEEDATKYNLSDLAENLKNFDFNPPELSIEDERFPGNDLKYKDVLKFELPMSESLKDTYKRVVEYFDEEISTFLRVDENVLIVSHENCLKMLIKYLENISDEEASKLDVSNDIILYELDENLKIIKKKELS